MSVKQDCQIYNSTTGPDTSPKIDSRRAKSIARKFLERYYSITLFKGAILEGRVWTVIMDVGHVEEHIMHVRADAETGTIMDSY
jgi:hypothetical protein